VVISEGLVVASVGRNFFMASKSPVSATTVVYPRSCSKRFAIIPPHSYSFLLAPLHAGFAGSGARLLSLLKNAHDPAFSIAL
jgi:hypothetical protein